MGTMALVLDLLAALPADILAPGVGDIPPYSQRDVCQQQQITHVIHGRDGENDVVDRTDAGQSEEVKHAFSKGEMSEHIIHGSYAHQEDGPDGSEKQTQQSML